LGELWDVFISHAREDKERVARPLASLLKAAGLRVWIDENELQLGDSLRRKIDHALAGSRYGVVVLSPAFFAKEWPQRELDALSALGSESQKIILPVWHGVDQGFVARHSPTLADKLAVSTDRGLDQVALAIVSVVSDSRRDDLKTYDENTPGPPKEFKDPGTFVGQTLKDYELVELLGSGGSGIVFRAIQNPAGRETALKIFYPVLGSLSHISELLERGFRALVALRHPNVAGVLDFDSAGLRGLQLSFLAMEYIRGLPLDHWSRSVAERPDSFRRRLDAAVQLAEGAYAAHNTIYTDLTGFQVHGVLHGDLKPANVLVTDNGQVKLLDFLLVDFQRLLDPRVVPPQYLRESRRPLTAAFGTLGFMAPEQEGHGIVTVKTDIFGLGATFCHLFAPTDDNPTIAALRGDGIPAALRCLLAEMIAGSPEARPDDMKTVLGRLREIRGDAQSQQGLVHRLRRLWQ
jgi:hypothetical protein